MYTMPFKLKLCKLLKQLNIVRTSVTNTVKIIAKFTVTVTPNQYFWYEKWNVINNWCCLLHENAWHVSCPLTDLCSYLNRLKPHSLPIILTCLPVPGCSPPLTSLQGIGCSWYDDQTKPGGKHGVTTRQRHGNRKVIYTLDLTLPQ